MSDDITTIKLAIQRMELRLEQALQTHSDTKSEVDEHTEQIAGINRKLWTINGALAMLLLFWDVIRAKLFGHP